MSAFDGLVRDAKGDVVFDHTRDLADVLLRLQCELSDPAMDVDWVRKHFVNQIGHALARYFNASAEAHSDPFRGVNAALERCMACGFFVDGVTITQLIRAGTIQDRMALLRTVVEGKDQFEARALGLCENAEDRRQVALASEGAETCLAAAQAAMPTMDGREDHQAGCLPSP